ncbi:unnamed protein product [Protopolystoma xenopodis]|uniref:SH3 domain-containing protein n=1 Tax=Protopolystoma xenopodis TaxID=117903 RepID=A0A3S5BFU7_9PLAT|nr:unnamed protein product [Protopolystoma xenopodis]
MFRLEKHRTKPVAFSVRTNISFDAILHGFDAPVPSRVVSFNIKDFLHIKIRFSSHWWIGRLVKIGTPYCFIPSPAKLELIRGRLPVITQTLVSPGNPGDTASICGNIAASGGQGNNGAVGPTIQSPTTPSGALGRRREGAFFPKDIILAKLKSRPGSCFINITWIFL